VSASPERLFPDLSPAEFEALKADIAKRGILIPVEVDESGNTLDGHHRRRACAELGVECPVVVRRFQTEQEKREHVRKINLLRRHLDPVTWGDQMAALLAERGVGRGQGARNDLTSATVAEVAKELGLPERTARRRLAMVDAPESIKEQLRSGAISEREAGRRIRKAERRAKTAAAAAAIAAEPPETAIGTFPTVVIDPPWRYENVTTRGAAEDHYPTISLDEMAKLEVPAGEDAHLYLWVTNTFLPAGFNLMDAWGFVYKTCLTWVKPQMGNGNWFRSASEHVLFGVRGDLPTLRDDVKTWFEAPRESHSKKPELFYRLVESSSPGPYLEMFARSRRGGWSAWGNEA
jgi:N6-adenosine-specific RNA methylase IME4